jgi:hypothetical protein
MHRKLGEDLIVIVMVGDRVSAGFCHDRSESQITKSTEGLTS